MVVIGIDSHKDVLVGCLIDATGKAVEYREISNTVEGHGELVSWAHDIKATVAIEGSGNYGRRAAEALVKVGVAVLEAPAQMTAAARRSRRAASKTDQIDALEIARIAVREEDLPPPPRCAADADGIACVVNYRRELVTERAAAVNRLHSDLMKIRCGYHNGIASLIAAKGLNAAARLLRGDKSPRAGIARARVGRIRCSNREIKGLEGEISWAVTASGTTLTGICGIAAVGAAEILAETGDPARFAAKARYAMANGTAPVGASSGRVKRHRLNRRGNRRLNKVIHTAALCQISHSGTEGRAYHDRCIERGKTKREALRILKRRILDRVCTHLRNDLKQKIPPQGWHRSS